MPEVPTEERLRSYTLPTKPQLFPGELQMHEGNLEGPIGLGEVFAWEPHLPWARELIVVTRIEEPPGDERVIYTRPFPSYGTENGNDEGRFREAVVRTWFRLMPTEKPALAIPSLAGLLPSMEGLRQSMTPAERAERDRNRMLWAMVRAAGGTIVVPLAHMVDAPRGTLHRHTDYEGRLVFRATLPGEPGP
jgi:hypothetical protein